jgi:pimeloyl-ACP methyl ester carboxylesterase
LAAAEGAPIAIAFAASRPERTRALAIYGGFAQFERSVMGPEALAAFLRQVEPGWGSGATLRHFAPTRAEDARLKAWWGRLERLSMSPTAALALARMNARIDVREMLPAIQARTLVL